MKRLLKSTFKHIALALTLVLLLGAFSSCGISLADLVSGFDDQYSEYKREFEISFDSESYGGNDFYYRQLDPTEQMMYNALVKEIESGKNYCVFEKVNASEIEKRAERVVHAIYSDHPEFFWLELGWYFVMRGGIGENNDKAMLMMGCCDFWRADSANGLIAVFEDRVDEIVSEASKLSTEFEKIRYVHDLIVSETEYNEAGAENNNSENNSPYICLVEKKAVCGGYSRTFQLLMNRLGIDCISVLGESLGEAHMWNCVYVEGEPYFMDLTWADNERMILYEWFCVTSEDIKSSHVPDGKFSIPVCDKSKYNFYVYNGYFMKMYDREGFNGILLKQKDNGEMFVKFSSVEEYRRAVADIVTNQNWNHISALEDKNRISYFIDEDMLVFIIYN